MDAEEKRRLSLGEFLQQSREKKGLSIKDVADELRLKISTVKALEENTYTDIGNLVYVKGYLRSYAKLLNVNIDKALQELKDPDNIPAPEAAKKNIEVNVDKAQKIATAAGIAEAKTDKTSIFIIVLILVMLIAIAFLWYERQHRIEMLPVAEAQAVPLSESPASTVPVQETPQQPAMATTNAPVVAPAVQPMNTTTPASAPLPETQPATPADKLPPDPSMISSVPPSVDPTMAPAPSTKDTTVAAVSPQETPAPVVESTTVAASQTSSPQEETQPKDVAKPFQSTIDITPQVNHIGTMPHLTSQENIVSG